MCADDTLRVVLCWHLHQPDYRDPIGGVYQAPWTYLHAIKDYTDMIAHIENNPAARVVFDFSPVLLDQLEDYRAQLAGYFAGTQAVSDPLLAALGQPVLPKDEEAQRGLMRACLQLNRYHMVNRYPPYRELVALAEWILAHPGSFHYLDERVVGDLLVWYHLAWLGEAVRRTDRRAALLMDKGRHFTSLDRRALMQIIHDLLDTLIARYRVMRDGHRIELAVTPYAHPILPLLFDFTCAREARADVALPASPVYPDGRARARWHIDKAYRVFSRYFGGRPAGCWPSEAAVSVPAVALLDECGFAWTASSQSVLLRSLGTAEANSDAVHRLYRLKEHKIGCFFRDDELSDLIGFRYKDWHADDAVADFMHRLNAIADAPGGEGRVVTIALDGENAWEHYPDNGYHFLSALYRAFTENKKLRLVTFSQCIEDPGVPVRDLGRLITGSWVHGDLTTWIGHPDKNRAWDMLVAAREHMLAVTAARPFDGAAQERIERALAVCEGSDWFWWLGEHNPELAVSQFERLFRMHLSGLYQLLGAAPPDYLGTVFAHGGMHAAGGAMRPGR